MNAKELIEVLAGCAPGALVELWIDEAITTGDCELAGVELNIDFEVSPTRTAAQVDADALPGRVRIALTSAATRKIRRQLIDRAATAELDEFVIDGETFQAAACIDGVLINPKLPENFNSTDNTERPESHHRWWNRPFVLTHFGSTTEWLEAWPAGVRYDVRRLDGGAWDRTSFLASAPTLAQALAFIQRGCK